MRRIETMLGRASIDTVLSWPDRQPMVNLVLATDTSVAGLWLTPAEARNLATDLIHQADELDPS